MEINYSGKSALIVDSKLEDLGSLRQILSRLGVPQVQVASSVNMALSLMREFTFDLCFACHEMGAYEKNGLQLLQEAKAEGIFKASSAFFLIVDPENSELLFGSLENSPDTYISKPYDIGKVRFRLEKQLRVKETIQPVEQLLDQGKYSELLEAVDVLIENYPGLNVFLQRVKGIALLRMDDYEDAQKLFSNLIQHRDLPWAEVGKGVAHFHQGEHERALECLNKVVDQQHISIEAYSWLSRTYRVKGQLERAVTLMRKAVMLQPTVPAIQTELAELAAQTADWGIAKDAYQQAIRYAKHSVFQIPENYFGLVRSLIESQPTNVDGIEADVIRVLEDVVMDFSEDHEVIFRAKLVNCDLYRKSNHPKKFEQMLLQTWRFFQRMNLNNQCKWMDVMYEASVDSNLQTEVSERRRELVRVIIELEWGKANHSAMAYYRRGEMDKAYRQFKKANELLPTHSGIALNLIQSGLELIKRGEEGLSMLLVLQKVISEISFGALPEKHQARFISLSQKFSGLAEVVCKSSEENSADPLSQEL
ncbi:MAG: tetratricopeptide repeat protein [Neptuniibacter sp.]